jgi:YegS/Rv2252/BmrU family lipid kinase
MSRKILFFINPVSGTTDKLYLEKKILEKCVENNVSFEILFTSAEGNYDFLREKIKADFITDIVICGGDGSIRPIVSSILTVDVNVGILPLGSGNGLARTAGIPGNIDKAFSVIFDGKTVVADAFLINKKLSCHVSGLGFDALVAHEFSKQKKRGLSSYTKEAIKNFFAAKTYFFTIESEEEIFDIDAFLICIANSNQFGNNFKIAPKASLCDGLLDIVVLKKTSKPQIVLSFVRQILVGKVRKINEKNFHQKNILYFQTSKMKIKNTGNAPFHIDGDPVETSKEFLIEVLPSVYKLIVP